MTSLGFEPGSILAFRDLCTTDVTTSRLPKKLGHLVEVNQRGYNASLSTVRSKNDFRFSTPHCALLDGFQSNQMTWSLGRNARSTKDLGL